MLFKPITADAPGSGCGFSKLLSVGDTECRSSVLPRRVHRAGCDIWGTGWDGVSGLYSPLQPTPASGSGCSGNVYFFVSYGTTLVRLYLQLAT